MCECVLLSCIKHPISYYFFSSVPHGRIDFASRVTQWLQSTALTPQHRPRPPNQQSSSSNSTTNDNNNINRVRQVSLALCCCYGALCVLSDLWKMYVAQKFPLNSKLSPPSPPPSVMSLRVCRIKHVYINNDIASSVAHTHAQSSTYTQYTLVRHLKDHASHHRRQRCHCCADRRADKDTLMPTNYNTHTTITKSARHRYSTFPKLPDVLSSVWPTSSSSLNIVDFQ